jgi:hypothetical protein
MAVKAIGPAGQYFSQLAVPFDPHIDLKSNCTNSYISAKWKSWEQILPGICRSIAWRESHSEKVTAAGN